MTDTADFSGSVRHSHGAADVLAGHYELGARLGEGGYGEVFEAWDRTLQRSVAVKRIKKADGARSGDGPIREARIAASLRHAAFVKVHAIEDDGPSQSIVMELVPGKTVRQVLTESRIDLALALDWVGQVAEAMHDAHQSGLVHGDLKPSNLMVEPSGRVRILDFGLSLRDDALATRSLSLTEPMGTIAYMAPEQLQGVPADARSDVYALGIILYELVCGTRPYAGLAGLALAAAHLQSDSGSWPYPDSASAPMIALIRAMTARHPQQRLASMAEIRSRLRALATRPGALPGAPWRWTVPGKRWWWAGAALLACALAFGGWQLAPRAVALLQRAAPYSQALDMRSGLDALVLFDRPGKLDQAGAHFARILDHTPGNAAAVAGMSLVYALRYAGDGQDEVWLQKAAAGAQQALTLNDQLALSHIANGWALANLGHYERALTAFDQALHLDPADFFAWYGKAHMLRRAGRLPQALQTLALASARFPRERVFADELGAVHFENGAYRDAEQAFRRSLALQPDAVNAYSNLNAALVRQDRQDEALRVLQQGLQIRPSAKLYGNLGNALFLRGDYVGAAAAFENAVSPTRGAPGDYLNWANLADTLLWIPGREQQARQAYGKARTLLAPRLARAPDDATLASRMALYAARSGDSAGALALAAHALALAPKNAQIQFRIGLAYELLGHRQKALDAILSARRLGYPSTAVAAEPDLVALRRDPAYPQD
ncbi:protein kinase [Massilia antarctica]|uniref:Protein kinase n=1 Tax=Massilia antarctica TaxID=2765360 RepID=A0AA49A5Z1_9BURK|nr:serine/threonine-protein kinase [Massilia antarctica]QPI47671.1 protein kinase [Massilia antarctica]